MSPLVWDLAHVGNFEEQWLVRAIGGREPMDPSLDDLYDAFRHPRPNRPSLPLLGPAEAASYLREVRGRVFDILDRLDLDLEPGPPAAESRTGGRDLLHDAFVYGMVLQHEHQHDETMLATLALMAGDGYRPAEPRGTSAGDRSEGSGRPGPGMVLIPGGTHLIGTDTDPWCYDNERAAHPVDLAPFQIGRFPVTNREYREFMTAGGYRDRRWWSEAGWEWRRAEAAVAPLFWHDEGCGSWSRNRFGHREDVPDDEPVQHVSWYEADAYCRWAGGRLPTEQEWEVAASWAEPGTAGTAPRRRFPWGDDAPNAARANLAGSGGRFGPSVIGSLPAGAAASGAEQMIGDVWEWTASDFGAYPGFASFPYREYSEVFFVPGYKVLRGGSWATHPLAIRNTFRNWDYPIRRQIFSGLRLARSA